MELGISPREGAGVRLDFYTAVGYVGWLRGIAGPGGPTGQTKSMSESEEGRSRTTAQAVAVFGLGSVRASRVA